MSLRSLLRKKSTSIGSMSSVRASSIAMLRTLLMGCVAIIWQTGMRTGQVAACTTDCLLHSLLS